mmetsp:Transcript_16221/g.30282  ORF Transcript_16221/g.30282 Transcript_16221/m.30282 type:complete len:348 (+) Transcript_16221:50-1093(+)
MEAADEFGYVCSKVHGVAYPGFVQEPVVDELLSRFTLRNDDIVIATFPKCGTTWMQQIVLSLLYGGDTSKVKDCFYQAPWIEWVTGFNFLGGGPDMNGKLMSVDELSAWDGDTEYGPGPGRRVFKTHAPVALAPWQGGVDSLKGTGTKVIVVVRNPKDACVSYFHHVQEVPEFQYTGSFEHMASKLYAKEKVEDGGFWSWYSGWEKAAAENPNIHWVSYEQLKRDGFTAVRDVANFLGLTVADDVLASALTAADFSAMKLQHSKLDEIKKEQGKYIKPGHFRQGLSGSWRNVIYGDLDKEFTAAHEYYVEKYGIRHEFDFGDDPAKPVMEPAKPVIEADTYSVCCGA